MTNQGLNGLNLKSSTYQRCDLGQIMSPVCAHISSADPSIPSRGDPARSTGCDTHVAVLGRLDVIEETVEKTVEHLEAEVKGLLSQLEGLAWNLPPGPFSPTPDLLGDDR
ncbi:placenta-specific protein 9 isoform X1 [Myotis lucifugus]|uniref:placenta-specific protein 9 isoform X1 n=1 Tax=Myotis lucifugus TaxID=59463 RepID=UPI000CCC0F05|nr:placenta-specific protein 9 isoform X1 [Myotis lucifugus]